LLILFLGAKFNNLAWCGAVADLMMSATAKNHTQIQNTNE